MSQSQARPAEGINPQEKDKKINELVQYLLVMDQKKLPIKKRDINKIVLKDCYKAFPDIMEKASARLLNIFGFKVIELEDKYKGTYILTNTLSNHEDKHLVWSEEESTNMALLSIILSMIFMNGNVIHDDDMWHALRILGLNKDETHDVFGDIPHLVYDDFVKQGYLEVTTQSNAETPVKEIRWGQRANHEFPRKFALQLACDLYQTQPKDWLLQYRQVQEESGGPESMEEG